MIKIMGFLLYLLQILQLVSPLTRLEITLTIKGIKLHIMMRIVHQVICILTHIKYLQQLQIYSQYIFLLHRMVAKLFLQSAIMLIPHHQ
jgi:hypothetical protein